VRAERARHFVWFQGTHMKHYMRWFGLLAVLHSAPSHALPAAGEYRSPFETYRRFKADEPLLDWRAANDQVRGAGGHVGLMKSDKKVDKPAAGSHAGHGPRTPPVGERK
jgi:hypothetical protein